MAATLTASQRRTGDAISDFAGKAAWVYLAAGILSVLFGAVVLSLVLDWVGLYTVALFVGVFLIAWGVLHILAALLDQPAHWVWHVLGGALSVAAGVLAIGWPDVTLFILVVIIGWSLIVWGILDLLSSFATYGMRHWWLYLIRGIVSIALGVPGPGPRGRHSLFRRDPARRLRDHLGARRHPDRLHAPRGEGQVGARAASDPAALVERRKPARQEGPGPQDGTRPQDDGTSPRQAAVTRPDRPPGQRR